ncbi:MAG: DUF4476 domain-containing protein [Bacteroidota bacterium]
MNKLFSILFFLGLIPLISPGQNRMLTDVRLVVRQYQGETFCDEPMSELDFEEYKASIARIRSEKLRFEKFRTTVADQCLATPYLFQLMELFTNPSLEYDVLRLGFYYCFDIENFKNLAPYMQGQVYRDRLESFVRERTFSIRADVEGQRELLSPSELRRTLEVLASYNTDQARVATAKEFVRSNNMRAEQFREIVEQVRLNNGKMDLLYYGYEYIYDPANYYAAYQELKRRDIAKLDAFVAENRRPDEEQYMSSRELGCTIILSKSEFDTHKRGIISKRYDSERLRFAKTLFDTYCFNVNELGQCMEIFKNDADRLELAAYAYRRIYDPWNFYLLGGRFNSEAKAADLFEVVGN